MAEPEKRTPRQPRVPPRHPEETTKPLWSRLGYALDLGLTLEPARKTTKPSGIRLRPDDKIRAVALLRESDLFSQCSDEHLLQLASGMRKRHYARGALIMGQDEPQTRMIVINSGTVERTRKDAQNRTQVVEAGDSEVIFGGLCLARTEPAYSSLRCTSEGGMEAYELTNSHLRATLRNNPVFAEEVIASLSLAVRRSKITRTPFLRQTSSHQSPLIPVSIAATIESFYRSGMNCLVNRAIMANTSEPLSLRLLFPAMHVQVPFRVGYINGVKGTRHLLHKYFPEDDPAYNNTWFRFTLACAPGVVMTPVVSVLEATNATANPEPLYRRWIRGVLPRGVREIIFAMGLNQMSEFFEERMPTNMTPSVRNMLGSLSAGVISGYLSHVPHNLSTLKLMTPNKSYLQHMRFLVDKYEGRLTTSVSNAAIRRNLAGILCVIAPAGVVVRTGQVVGSFIILNGIIQFITTMQQK